MSTRTHRRADDLVRVWDNLGETFDRYTVTFREHPDADALGIGPTGNHPAGFCMHVGHVDPGPHLGTEIRLWEMLEPARLAVLAELRGFGYTLCEGRAEYGRGLSRTTVHTDCCS